MKVSGLNFHQYYPRYILQLERSSIGKPYKLTYKDNNYSKRTVGINYQPTERDYIMFVLI